MIRIIVNGANGKMGRTIVDAVTKEKDFMLAGVSGRNDDLAGLIKEKQADVVVDFTHPSAAFENSRIILSSYCNAVVGTTGLTEAQAEELNELAIRNGKGILTAPNFSIGAVLMMRFAAEASKWFNSAEIVEYHHDEKADSPSGTAMKTAEMILEASGNRNPKVLENREFLGGSRGGEKGGVHIHAVRLPGFIASQEVLFGGPGEVLTIRHDATGRETFLPGVFLAVRKIMNIRGLVNGLEKILD